MIDYEKLKQELEKIYQFLYGSQCATTDKNAENALEIACHKLGQIINEMQE